MPRARAGAVVVRALAQERRAPIPILVCSSRRRVCACVRPVWLAARRCLRLRRSVMEGVGESRQAAAGTLRRDGARVRAGMEGRGGRWARASRVGGCGSASPRVRVYGAGGAEKGLRW